MPPQARGISTRMAGILAARGTVVGRRDRGLVRGSARRPPRSGAPARTPACALARLTSARDRGERVLVFGDFDADGLTGLAIMTLALRRFGVAVEPYVPSRLDEGHGLSLAALDAAAAGGCTVIVTVDCGSTSVAEIAAANARGIDVIVTDHHRVPAVLPAALAVVNPHRPDSTYPDRRLAGSGVAFKIAQLLLANEPGGPRPPSTWPTSRRSDRSPTWPRSSARTGRSPGSGSSGCDARRGPGIAALLERARIAPAAVDLETVAFAIAPRLNAAGRVGEALEAARLLLADGPGRGGRPRRRPRGRQPDPARPDEDRPSPRRGRSSASRRRPPPRSCAARGASGSSVWSPPGWPRIAAGRRSSGRTSATSSGPRAGATARSTSARPSSAAPTSSSASAVMPGRPGSSCRPTAGTSSASASWPSPPRRRRPTRGVRSPIDLALPALDVDYGLYRELAGLAPCGPGNPDPLVAVLGLTVTRVRAATGGHSQLTLRRDRDVLDGIAFGRSDIAEVVREGDRLDVVARLTSRTFGGFESLQLDIRDVATSGSHPETAAVLADRGLGAVARRRARS